jgi:hypothetical protein
VLPCPSFPYVSSSRPKAAAVALGSNSRVGFFSTFSVDEACISVGEDWVCLIPDPVGGCPVSASGVIETESLARLVGEDPSVLVDRPAAAPRADGPAP